MFTTDAIPIGRGTSLENSSYAPRTPANKHNISATELDREIGLCNSHCEGGNCFSFRNESPLELSNLNSSSMSQLCSKRINGGKFFLLEINDFRYGGLSSQNANERQAAQDIHNIMFENVLPNIFPHISEEMWEDNYHFNKAGFVCFSKQLACNFKQYLQSINFFWEGMRLFVVSDSTLDFLNYSDGTWFGCGDWVGHGKIIFEEHFRNQGMEVIADTACGTGFALSSWAGLRFGERMKNHREKLESLNQWQCYDVVLIIGGYNDIISRNHKELQMSIFKAV